MDGSRFDTWTRRRFGLAAGGALAALARLASPEDADANKKDKNKKRKKRCRKVGQICRQSGNRKRCCNGKACEDFDGQNYRCCKRFGQTCAADGECCTGYCIVDRCGVT